MVCICCIYAVHNMNGMQIIMAPNVEERRIVLFTLRISGMDFPTPIYRIEVPLNI